MDISTPKEEPLQVFTIFRGSSDFTLIHSIRLGQFRGQKGLGSLKKSQEMPDYKFCPRQKDNITHFQNQRYIGIFMSL
jgi:hypothetical protein